MESRLISAPQEKVNCLLQPYFDGCWDPHMKDMKRAVGDAWFRKGRGNTCCFGVCRKQGQVVAGCTAQACGFVPYTCPDENCSYSRRDPGKLLDIMIENEVSLEHYRNIYC